MIRWSYECGFSFGYPRASKDKRKCAMELAMDPAGKTTMGFSCTEKIIVVKSFSTGSTMSTVAIRGMDVKWRHPIIWICRIWDDTYVTYPSPQRKVKTKEQLKMGSVQYFHVFSHFSFIHHLPFSAFCWIWQLGSCLLWRKHFGLRPGQKAPGVPPSAIFQWFLSWMKDMSGRFQRMCAFLHYSSKWKSKERNNMVFAGVESEVFFLLNEIVHHPSLRH